MPTLQELRKAKYPTIKSFALQCGISPSKASTILQGRHANAISPNEVRHIANVLEVSFQEFVDAQSQSYAEWHEQSTPKPTMSPEEHEANIVAAVDIVYSMLSSEQRQRLRGNQRETKSPIETMPLTNIRKAKQ